MFQSLLQLFKVSLGPAHWTADLNLVFIVIRIIRVAVRIRVRIRICLQLQCAREADDVTATREVGASSRTVGDTDGAGARESEYSRFFKKML